MPAQYREEVMMMEEEIKEPCPFCGARPEERDEKGRPVLSVFSVYQDSYVSYIGHSKSENADWEVSCNRCLAEGPLAHSREEAIRLWNRRAHSERSKR